MIKFADISLIVIIIGIIILIGACYYLWQQQSHLEREIKSLQYKFASLSGKESSPPLPPTLPLNQNSLPSQRVMSAGGAPQGGGSHNMMESMMKGMLGNLQQQLQMSMVPQQPEDDEDEEEEDEEENEEEDEEDDDDEEEEDDENEEEEEMNEEDTEKGKDTPLEAVNVTEMDDGRIIVSQEEEEEQQEEGMAQMDLTDLGFESIMPEMEQLPEIPVSQPVPEESIVVEEVSHQMESVNSTSSQTELDELRAMHDVARIRKVLELKKRSELQGLCEQLQVQFKPSGGYASKPELISVLLKHLF